MAITVTKGLIGKEDISFNPAGVTPESFTRTAAGATTQSITKLAPQHLNIVDAGNYIAATNLEDAIQELALDITNLQEVASQGQGADIASGSILTLDDNSLFFIVTGTTQINSILQTSVADGRTVILRFEDSLVMEPTNLLRLKSGRFTTQAGDVMMLFNDNNVFIELTRWHDHGEPLHSGATLIEMHLEGGVYYATGRDIFPPPGWDKIGSSGWMISTDEFGSRF